VTRILVLSDLWLPFPGGAERLMFNLARDLMRKGSTVNVVTGYEYPQQFDGPTVVSLPTIGPDPEHGAAVIRDLIAYDHPDVILTHHHYAHLYGDVMVDSGIPVVQLVLNGKRLAGAALAVYISEWVEAQAGDAEPQDLVLTPPAMPDVVAATHGDAIGFIKPIPHKGVRLVYQVAALMPRRRFVILRGEWQDLEVIEPAPNVEFLEPVADIRDFYARCRVVLMPSLSEDAGSVAQECTVNGIPCISTNVGGLAETNAGGRLMTPAATPAQWVDQIEALDDPTEYAALVDAQRRHLAATDHGATLDLLASRIFDLYPATLPHT
jgi:glycosyltransferase involved in cell wall biosynthesis